MSMNEWIIEWMIADKAAEYVACEPSCKQIWVL